MSADRRWEPPTDPLDAMNARLDFEAQEARQWILYTDRVERDIEKALGGKVNANDRAAYNPHPRRPPSEYTPRPRA